MNIIELLEQRQLLSGSFETHVNFQAAKSATPARYVADVGAVYGAHSNGLSYGWNTPLRAQTVSRNVGKNPTTAQLLNHSFAVMNHKGRGSVWEIAVPNGTYTVTITAGDIVASGLQQIEANGVIVVNGRSTAKSRWVVGTQSIVVTDGLLKLTDPRAGTAKIDAIDIVQQIPQGGGTPGSGGSAGGTGGTTAGTLTVKGTNVTITRNAAGGVRTIVDGATTDYAASQWAAVEFDGTLQDQSLNILATVVPTSLKTLYGNSRIGDPSAGLQLISAALDIQSLSSTVTISDVGDTVSRTASLTQASDTTPGLLHGLSPADVTFSGGGSELILETGAGDDTVALKNSFTNMIVTNTGGNDQFTVGDGSVASLPVPMLFLASAGHNSITLNDGTDAGGAGVYNLISQASPVHYPDLVAGKDVSELDFMTAPFPTPASPAPQSGIIFDNATTSSFTINAVPSGTNNFTVHSHSASNNVLPAQVTFNGNGDSAVQIDGNYNSTRFAVTANQLKVSSFGAAGAFSKGLVFTGVEALNSPALFAAGSVFTGATLSAGHLHAGDSVLDFSSASEVELGGGSLLSLDYSAGDALPPTLFLNGSFTMSGLPVDHDPLAGHRILFGNRMYIQYTPSTEAATLALVKKYLTKAYTGGTWQPTGDDYISSQQANLDGKHSIGYANQASHIVSHQPANTIEIYVTRIGDTDLDGHTTATDLARLQAHLGQSGNWEDGDLNYDGIIDNADLALLQRYLET